MKRIFPMLFILTLALGLGACDQMSARLGLENPAKKAARLDAEGRAVGGGCRQSGRAIEDCYAIYAWLPMESIYAGWREMDEYMRENKLDTTTPVLPPVQDPSQRRKKKANANDDAAQANEPVPVSEASKEAAAQVTVNGHAVDPAMPATVVAPPKQP